jgi:hypothetical protein
VGEGEEEPATAAHDASSVRTTSAVGVEPYREVSAARDPDSIIARLFAARRSFPERARRERNELMSSCAPVGPPVDSGRLEAGEL